MTAEKQYKTITRTRAFTFIEVLAALAVTAIALVGLLRLHLFSIRMADAADADTRAVLLAQGKISETLAAGYPDVGVDTGQLHDDPLNLCWRTEVSEFRLPEFDAAEAAGLRQIAVDVTWNQGLRRKHLRMSTCVADSKLQ